jgi:hypothetical protein
MSRPINKNIRTFSKSSSLKQSPDRVDAMLLQLVTEDAAAVRQATVKDQFM